MTGAFDTVVVLDTCSFGHSSGDVLNTFIADEEAKVIGDVVEAYKADSVDVDCTRCLLANFENWLVKLRKAISDDECTMRTVCSTTSYYATHNAVSTVQESTGVGECGLL